MFFPRLYLSGVIILLCLMFLCKCARVGLVGGLWVCGARIASRGCVVFAAARKIIFACLWTPRPDYFLFASGVCARPQDSITTMGFLMIQELILTSDAPVHHWSHAYQSWLVAWYSGLQRVVPCKAKNISFGENTACTFTTPMKYSCTESEKHTQ